jgi:hypothetical protein
MDQLYELEKIAKTLCLDIKIYRKHNGVWELTLINTGDNKDMELGNVVNWKCDIIDYMIRDAILYLNHEFKH